jgi:hypothetical protein
MSDDAASRSSTPTDVFHRVARFVTEFDRTHDGGDVIAGRCGDDPGGVELLAADLKALLAEREQLIRIGADLALHWWSGQDPFDPTCRACAATPLEGESKTRFIRRHIGDVKAVAAQKREREHGHLHPR